MTNKDLEEALYIASHLQDFTEFKVREVIEGLVKEVKELQFELGKGCDTCKFDGTYSYDCYYCGLSYSIYWRSKE